MEKRLGQGDIDALFAAAQAKATAEVDSRQQPQYERYNFSRAGQISSEQLRAISTVNDLFARNLGHTLGAWLRTEFKVALVAGEQMPCAEFLERLGKPTYICSLRLEPMDAIGLMEIELSLAQPVLDLLVGGTGLSIPARELTDIEEELLLAMVQVVIQELNTAWLNMGLNFALEKREVESQIQNAIAPAERTLCVSFEVRMQQAQGTVNLCLPAVVLNSMLRTLIAEGDRPRRRSQEARRRMREIVGEAGVGAVLQLPPVRISGREMMGLAPGMVLRLPLADDEDGELCLGGIRLGGAHPVRVGEHRGLQIMAAQGGTSTEQACQTR